MTFVKYENGILLRCPKSGTGGKSYHSDLPLYYNNHPDKAYADGYLELVETERPAGNCIPRYTVVGSQLVQSWEMLPDPEPVPDPFEQIRADIADLTDAILDMSAAVYS